MSTPSRKPRNVWIVVLPVAFFGFVLSLCLLGILSLYVFSWDGAPARFLAGVFPFPAATVDGTVVRWSVWNDDTRAFMLLAEQGKVSIPGAITRDQIGKDVLDRLIRNAILKRVADEHGITVSDAEVNAEYVKIKDGPKDQAALAEMLKSLGWSEADVKSQVVMPYLLGRTLSERLGSVAAAEKELADAAARAKIQIFVKL